MVRTRVGAGMSCGVATALSTGWFARGFWSGLGLMVVTVSVALVAVVLRRRVVDNPLGLLFLAMTLVLGAGGAFEAWARASSATLPGSAVAGWAAAAVWPVLLGLATIPPLLLFPTGRLRSPRWRPALALAPAFILCTVLGNGLDPAALEGADNPFGVAGAGTVLEVVLAVAGLCLLAGTVSGLVCIALRYRDGDVVERQQFKWFIAGSVLVVVGLLVADGFREAPDLQLVASAVSLVPLPVAIGIAITRHGLYEIDRLVSRTLTYALVTVVLGAVYTSGVVVLRVVLTGTLGESDVAVAGSTLLVAVLFGTVRRRAQNLVDRRFNRSRYDATTAVEDFGHGLREKVDLVEVVTELRVAVATTVAPRSVDIWLPGNVPGTERDAAS